MNALHVDAACVGEYTRTRCSTNPEATTTLTSVCTTRSPLTPGYPHMTKLVGDTNFPWLLSNVIDANTGGSPAPLKPYVVMERCGVRVGIVGLVEQ